MPVVFGAPMSTCWVLSNLAACICTLLYQTKPALIGILFCTIIQKLAFFYWYFHCYTCFFGRLTVSLDTWHFSDIGCAVARARGWSGMGDLIFHLVQWRWPTLELCERFKWTEAGWYLKRLLMFFDREYNTCHSVIVYLPLSLNYIYNLLLNNIRCWLITFI